MVQKGELDKKKKKVTNRQLDRLDRLIQLIFKTLIEITL